MTRPSPPVADDGVVAMRAAFKAFFDEKGANVEWEEWGEGRVLVDDVFNLDELLVALTDSVIPREPPSGNTA